ncbi:MAG: endonuclease III domain-containing protein [Candidatus Hydrothermarchaeales archaeon]
MRGKELLDIYDALSKHFGKQNWWPAETPFEVIVGAILTQNTAWQNVVVAIDNLKAMDLLSPDDILNVKGEALEECFRPTGYFRIKAKRLKNFITFLFDEFDGDLDNLFSLSKEELRAKLLGVNGIGPETADSIILYAGEKTTFVIDAYTKRIFGRLSMVGDVGYEELKQFFEDNLPKDVELYKEFHALIVVLGKNYCKAKPLCEECPLGYICNFAIPPD